MDNPALIFLLVIFVIALVLSYLWNHKKVPQEGQEKEEVSAAVEAGREGEKIVSDRLNSLCDESKGDKVFNDCLFGTKQGSTQMDHIFVNSSGVFVVETKNYSGMIYGDDSQEKWYQGFGESKKYEFYNPVKQNTAHVNYLQKMLGKDIKIYSVVVFVQNNLISLPNNSAINLNDLKKTIKKKPTGIYSKAKMKKIEDKIQSALERTTATMQDHLDYVSSRSDQS